MNNISSDFAQFDIIGDIHGHANDLKQLLNALGYKKVNGVYTHPTRKVLFLGDYIDRGINAVEVLSIVKGMVDHHQAIALMGNHEYNAICYNYKNKQGEYYRKHNTLHTMQHQATLDAFKTDLKLYHYYIEWFKTLPLFFDGSGFRAVHACWDEKQITLLKNKLTNNCITVDILEEANTKGSELYYAIEETLKGKEIELPTGFSFKDKDGHKRTSIRIKWWKEPQNETFKSISVLPIEELSDDYLPLDLSLYHYPIDYAPVFFGHYWLSFTIESTPKILTSNACCLDYSVAKKGKLVCYRYNGERKLNSDNLIYL